MRTTRRTSLALMTTAALGLGACFLPDPPPVAEITVDPASWDFGSRPVLTFDNPAEGTKSFTISNNTDEPITVAPVVDGFPAFRLSSNLCSTVAPGNSCTVVVAFGVGSPGTWTGDLDVHRDTIDGPVEATATLSGVTTSNSAG